MYLLKVAPLCGEMLLLSIFELNLIEKWGNLNANLVPAPNRTFEVTRTILLKKMKTAKIELS